MKQENFVKIKILIAVLCGALISASIINGNYILPIAVFILSAALVFSLKKRTKGVMEDERDDKIAGFASRKAYSIFAMGAALLGAVLVAMGKNQPELLPIGYTLAYSVCALMLIYILFFKYYSSKPV